MRVAFSFKLSREWGILHTGKLGIGTENLAYILTGTRGS